ncbi:polysaccharide biosynthesis/export family protein [Alkalimarinus coralli]|uniref:polysaccharide biosynthesis/export family protein n=1 Tax=Alkalimarinus coralli TaxID=2935863 RepID=UPI00202B0722|nr:polysaccharide biosynthesis/export family protein [Alkalimarinus coralli]
MKYRFLAMFISVILMTGCATPKHFNGEEFELNIVSDQGAGDLSKNDHFAQHFQPEDELDVIFRFDEFEGLEYKLAADDVVEVTFIAAPDLSFQQRIRPDGKISLPYLGGIKASGKTVETLQEELIKLYEKSLVKPELYISLIEHGARTNELKTALGTRIRGQSRLLRVRSDYVVTFPIIGDIDVRQMGIKDLGKKVNQLYAEEVPGLEVDIILNKYADKTVYVLGEVLSPGAFSVSKPISLLQALALSGGIRPGAQLEHTIAMHRVGDKMVARRFDLKAALEGRSMETALAMLQPDDIVYIPSSDLSRASEVTRFMKDVLFFRGIGVTFGYDFNE